MNAERDLLPVAGARVREFERKALEIRRFAGLKPSERLDPLVLAATLKLRVIHLNQLNGLSEHARNHLEESDSWSGGITKTLPDGSRVIVINDRQSSERQAATLMEEICHALLGHQPSTLSTGGRSYDRAVEEEAYGVGAAALAPYAALTEALTRKETAAKIAKRLGVTRSLIEYRMKVLGLWSGATGVT